MHARNSVRSIEKSLTLVDSPYTVLPYIYNIIKVDTTGGNVRVNLPAVNYPIDIIKTSSDSYIVTIWVGGTQIGEVAGELSSITVEGGQITKDEPWYPYDAIVGIAGVSGDGGEVLAKDRFGRVIAGGRGVAGTDDSTVLNAAAIVATGGVLSSHGSMTLNSSLNLPINTILDANMPLRVTTGGTELPHWTINCDIGIICGSLAAGSIGRTIRNLRLRSATAHTNIAIDVRKSYYSTFQNIAFANFDKCLHIQGMYTSRLDNVYNYDSNYCLYTKYTAGVLATDFVLTGFSPCNCVNWGVYFENDSARNIYIFGNIGEQSTGGFTGEGIHIGTGCRDIHVYSMYLGMSDSSKFAFDDNGAFNHLHGCTFAKGTVKIYSEGGIDSGCRFSSATLLQLAGSHVKLSEATFYGVTDVEKAIEVVGANCIISECTFMLSPIKYYIYVNASGLHIVNSNFKTVDNTGLYPGAAYPIYINAGNDIVISDCDVIGNPNAVAGIRLPASSNIIITNCPGFVHRGERRTYVGSIATLTQDAFNSLDNPFGQNVAILSLDIYVSAGATATTPNIDCGVGSSATTDYTNLFDDLPGETIGLYNSKIATPGTQTQPVLWQTGAGNRYLNMSIKDAAATGMVATYVVTVMGL